MLTRRNLLKTVAGLLIPAPMIVRAETLMVLPKPLVVPQKFRQTLFGDIIQARVFYPGEITYHAAWSLWTSDLRYIWDDSKATRDGPEDRLKWSYRGSEFVFSTEAVQKIGFIRPILYKVI